MGKFESKWRKVGTSQIYKVIFNKSQCFEEKKKGNECSSFFVEIRNLEEDEHLFFQITFKGKVYGNP